MATAFQASRLPKRSTASRCQVTYQSKITATDKSLSAVNERTPTHRDEDTDQYDPRKDRRYQWYMLATIFGAAGGVIGVFTLIWQSFLLRSSINASHNAERARVDAILRVDWPNTFFDVHNFCKSAAIITGYKLTHATFSSEDTAFTEDAPERTIHEAKIMKHVLVPADGLSDVRPSIFFFDITNFLSEEERRGEHVTLFTASLTYEDIFDAKHATQTTYRYTPSINVPNVGSLEYLSRYTRYT